MNSCDSAECYEACDKKNLGHGVCATKKALQVSTVPATAIPSTATESSIVVPVAVSASCALFITLAAWRYYTHKKEKEVLLQSNDNDFHALPDIVY